ncbi:uncharacterized protein LOC127427963 isoform X1 [Myxocyprinus asiaticus]|uniref:uncharacterized protein LOC127427963 isoform X1 n=1 Tax=Myxocyprinus asiaticus TaxID=70543 RepID=UPI0022228CFE|nr:uncharacterized protein LOC127427963 isoform X1 [Myxocyprinus asiaticus]
MGRRCVFGCSDARTLFSFPTVSWLRSKWLEFVHFEERGICASSRLCNRHFSDDSFTNLGMFSVGAVSYLTLAETAFPTLYTVGPSPPAQPLTREVGCQCHGPLLKNASVQAIRTQKKPKIRSKAIQVKPLVSHCASVSCSEEDFAVSPKPPFTLLPIKRPRMEESTVESTKGSWLHRTEKPTDSTFQIPTVKQEDDVKLEPCDSSYIVVTI